MKVCQGVKVITCLDGKERQFCFYEDGSVFYNIWKNNKTYGATSCFNLNKKLPKFITKELLEVK